MTETANTNSNQNFSETLREFLIETTGKEPEKTDIEKLKHQWVENKRNNQTKELQEWFDSRNNPEGLKQQLILDLKENKRTEATEKLVKYVKANHFIKTTRSDKNPEIWVYEEGIYKSEGHTRIAETLRWLLKEHYTTQILTQVTSKIQADTYVDSDEFFKAPQLEPYLVCCLNGIVDIKTGEIKPHTHKKVFFSKVPVKYVENAECTAIKHFLKETLGTIEDSNLIAEFIGYCLLRTYPYSKSLMLIGAGQNGKSQVLKLFRKVLGEDSVVSVPLQNLEKEKFHIYQLFGKLSNIVGDLSDEALKGTGTFKQLTGGDYVMADRKNLEPIRFENHAKMIFSCNQLPRTPDTTDAFFRRWIMINFPYKFYNEETYKELVEEQKVNAKIGKPEIITSITSEEELEGLLYWSIQSIRTVLEKDSFSTSQTADYLRNEWSARSNSLAGFCNQYIEKNLHGQISKHEFRVKYGEFCEKYNLKKVGDKVIKSYLEREYYVEESRDESLGMVRCWIGIKFL